MVFGKDYLKIMMMRVTIFLFLINTVMGINGQTKELVKNGNVTLNLTIYSGDIIETIILLHGGPGVPDDMIEVVNILKDKYRVITFEQRGVGLSECNGGRFTMNDYISDIDAILKYFNLNEFHLLGHSWGGLYAQIYANKKPERIKSLFLCSPSSGTNQTWKKTEKEVLQFNKKMTSNGEWLSMGWNSFLGMLGSDKAYRNLFKQVLKNYHKSFGYEAVDEEFLNKIHSKPINKTRKEIIKYNQLTELTNPDFNIIVTYGDNDIYGKSKNQLIKRYPTAKIEIIEKCGHIPWKHNPKEFEIILNRFYFS